MPAKAAIGVMNMQEATEIRGLTEDELRPVSGGTLQDEISSAFDGAEW
jgi:hypothetical protein